MLTPLDVAALDAAGAAPNTWSSRVKAAGFVGIRAVQVLATILAAYKLVEMLVL